MLHALILGFRQLADPAVQRLLLRCVLLTLATFSPWSPPWRRCCSGST